MPPLRLCLESRVSLPIVACHLCTWHTMPGNLKAAMQVGTAISNMRPSAHEDSISQKTFLTLASCALICVPEQVRVAHYRRRPVHRRARQAEDGHRGLSLVCRLGPRHHDCPTR